MSASRTVPHRRQRTEDDEDADATDESQTHASRTTGSSIKRPRVEQNQPNDDDNEGDEEEEEDTVPNTQIVEEASDADNTQEAGATQISSTQAMGPATTEDSSDEFDSSQDGFKPGAIVRIKLTDFVTYTSAEFFPGPKLNMVIGPNGTGKSTLVCAICLGLGWGPQQLGRAKDIGEFVKHGSTEATIEIELARQPKRNRNPVLCRTIRREGNKSFFTVNGQPANRGQVLKIAQSFSIQIDNLCQFLPQDKVSEFAALTPVELLYSTQRAAAGPEMISFHDDLKRLRSTQKKMQVNNKSDRESLSNLETRQEMQKADVERMRQRGQIRRKIEMLEFARPIVRYKDQAETTKVINNRKTEIERQLVELKSALEPALREVNVKQEYSMKLGGVTKRQKRMVERADQAARASAKKIEEHEDAMKDLNHQIEAERKSGQHYRHEANKIVQTINRLKRQLNEEPVEFDVNFYNEGIREKRNRTRELELKASEIQKRKLPLVEQHRERSLRIGDAEKQLSSLDSQSGRQESLLRSYSQETYAGYKWLLENQHRFEKEVFPPPIVCCSVTDPKYADSLESLFGKTDFTSFTTQTRNDFRTLQKILTMDMGFHDITINTCTNPNAQYRTPVSDEEMKALGFDGWAKDFLTGPQPVVALFRSEKNLDQTPIRLGDITDEEYARLESGLLSSWIAGKHAYQVIRRKEYGPSATSTRVRQVRPARVWTSQPVEESVKQELASNIEAWKQELSEVQEKIEADKGLLSQYLKERSGLKEEWVEIEREKSSKQTALVSFRAIPEKINQQEVKQKDLERFFQGIKDRVADIRVRQDQISVVKAEATIDYTNSVESLRQQYEKLINVEIRHIEARSDFEILSDRNSTHKNRVDEKENELGQVMLELKESAEAGKRIYDEARKVIKASKREQDLGEMLRTLTKHTTEQLEADIDSEKARLELTQGGNKNVIKEFEEREKQIQSLRKKLNDFEKELGNFNDAINEIRAKWEPRLDDIVQKLNDAFSDSFSRIGCAGQVSLDKAEGEDGPDFDQWSIQIHVKFRENESLSQLDSHRQSGGERAVSTIFYLMALQSLSASPFRVVDEINQGMDPRNERMVHERMVDIACARSENAVDAAGRGGGQYFLITPKLLNGLAYKPGMKVLCIVTGEHMPHDYNLVDFSRAAKKMKAIVANRSKGNNNARAIGAGAGGSSGNVDVHA